MTFYDFRKTRAGSPTAAALAYDPVGSDPPQIVATGKGLLAEEIVQIAHEHNVPLHEDAALVAALYQLDGGAIPTELYAVVAEVLAFVYRLDRQDW